MRLRQFFQDRAARLAAAQYDPRAHRLEVTEALAECLEAHGFHLSAIKPENEGPLGGESDRIEFWADTPAGVQKFYCSVYARGVYSRSQEEQFA